MRQRKSTLHDGKQDHQKGGTPKIIIRDLIPVTSTPVTLLTPVTSTESAAKGVIGRLAIVGRHGEEHIGVVAGLGEVRGPLYQSYTAQTGSLLSGAPEKYWIPVYMGMTIRIEYI